VARGPFLVIGCGAAVAALLTYVVLRGRGEWITIVSYRELGVAAGFARRTAISYVELLEDHGLVRTILRMNPNGGADPTGFQILAEVPKPD